VIGTPEFMSPSSCSAIRFDARSDLYALGCILHLMLTAAPAFDAPTREQMIKRRLSENPPHAQELDPGIPDAVDRVIAKLLARTPDDATLGGGGARALSGPHTRRLSGDGTPLAAQGDTRSAQTIVFARRLRTTRRGESRGREPRVKPAARRRRRPQSARVAVGARRDRDRGDRWSSYARCFAAEVVTALRAGQRDSARRAESVRKVDSARKPTA
jgi:hypothetical protein